MKKLILLLVVVFSTGTTCFGQTADEKFSAAIEKYFELSGSNKTFDIVLTQMSSMVPETHREWFSEHFSSEAMKDLVASLVPVYQKHYTLEEIEALNAFYESPTGRSIAAKTPAVTEESMIASQQWAMKLLPKMQEEMQKRAQ